MLHNKNYTYLKTRDVDQFASQLSAGKHPRTRFRILRVRAALRRNRGRYVISMFELFWLTDIVRATGGKRRYAKARPRQGGRFVTKKRPRVSRRAA